jgi:hypothetical protein
MQPNLGRTFSSARSAPYRAPKMHERVKGTPALRTHLIRRSEGGDVEKGASFSPHNSSQRSHVGSFMKNGDAGQALWPSEVLGSISQSYKLSFSSSRESIVISTVSSMWRLLCRGTPFLHHLLAPRTRLIWHSERALSSTQNAPYRALRTNRGRGTGWAIENGL